VNKRFVALMVVVLYMMLSAGQLMAAALPPNLGMVQDRAGILTNEEKNKLRSQAAEDNDLQFYLLTLSGLNGQSIEQYAEAVFAHWKLTEQDALIVVAKQEKLVQLHVTNPSLYRALSTVKGTSGESTSSELIKHYFVASAEKGKYAEGLSSLMRATRELAAVDATDQTLHSSESMTYFEVLGIIVAFYMFIITIFSLIALSIIGLRLRRKLALVQADISGQMALIQSSLERLEPLTAMSQGKTNQLALELTRMLHELLVETQVLHQAAGRSGFLLYVPGLQKALKNATESCEAHIEKVATRTTQVEALLKEESTISRQVEQLRIDIPIVKQRLQELAPKLNSSLDRQQRQLAELEQIFQGAEKSNVFDPMAAAKAAQQARELLDLLIADLDELVHYDQLIASFPDREHASRQDVWKVINNHHLHALPFNPYAPIEQSKELIVRMQHNLQVGNVFSLRSQWDQAEQLLQSAVSAIQRIADIKLSNRNKIATLDQRIGQIHDAYDSLQRDVARVRDRYAKSIWQDMHSEYERATQQLSKLAAQLDEAVQLNDDTTQDFENANKLLDHAAEQMSTLEQQIHRFSQNMLEWDQSFKLTVERFEKDLEQYKQMLHYIRTGNLILPDQQLEKADALMRNFGSSYRAVADAVPYDLQQMIRNEQDHHEAIEAFINLVQELDRYKRDAEQWLAQLQLLFEQEYKHTTGMKYKRDLQNNYRYLREQIQQALSMGQYDQAYEHLSQLYQLTGSLQNVNMERRFGGIPRPIQGSYIQRDLSNQFNNFMNGMGSGRTQQQNNFYRGPRR